MLRRKQTTGADTLRVHLNPAPGTPGIVVLPAAGFRRAKAELIAWPGYAPTPLQDSPAIAAAARVQSVQRKAASPRPGLGSFEALGAAYAVADALLAHLARNGVRAATADLLARTHPIDLTIACTGGSDHAIGVAWAAQRFGARCIVFHDDTASHIDAIARFGATIRRGDTAAEAARHGWTVISQTARSGDTETPRLIMQAARLMADEALDQWQGSPPTHAIVPGGDGSLAAAISAHLRARLVPVPKLLVVEPEIDAVLLAHAAGTPNPGAEPSLLAWQELERAATAFLAIDAPRESAALAALYAATTDSALRAALGFTRESRILLFGAGHAA